MPHDEENELPGDPIDLASGLLAPPESLERPPTVTRLQELPFHELTWENFERLCVQLARHRGKPDRCQRYGVLGQKQHGIDIYVTVLGPRPYIVYQCKHYRELDTATVRDSIDTFIRARWVGACSEFILCTTAAVEDTKVADEIEAQTPRLKKQGVTLVPWGRAQLSERLKELPRVVDDFFGRAWVEAFCGRDAVLELRAGARAGISSVSAEGSVRQIEDEAALLAHWAHCENRVARC